MFVPCVFRTANEMFFREDPLWIVRGEGTYLFDEHDNRYLDCINNVCHGRVTTDTKGPGYTATYVLHL